MATRTPSLQARSRFHHYWGQYATAATLPNATGNPIGAPYFAELEVGDVAYVTGLAELYQCTSVGTSGIGDAVWTSAGAGHQTARFIVGNALAGDTIHTCDFLDPGNGTGLAAAITAATALGYGVDIFVRAGTITLNPALVALPLVLPANCTLRGAGQHATIIVTGNGAGATPLESFQLSIDTVVHDIRFIVPAYDAAAAAGFNIFGLATYVTVKDVTVSVTTSAVDGGVFAIFNAYLGANAEGIYCENVTIDAPVLGAGYATAGLYAFFLQGSTLAGQPYPEAKVPARFINCVVNSPGQYMFAIYSNFLEIEVDGLLSSGLGGVNAGITGYANLLAKAYKGPKVSRLVHDAQGVPTLQPSGSAYGVYISVTNGYTAGAQIVGTEIDRVSVFADVNVPGSDLVVITTRAPFTGGSVSDCQAYDTDAAGVMRLGLFSDNTGVLTSFAVNGCTVPGGLIIISESASTTSDNRVVNCESANLQIVAGCTNTIVVANRITVALTDAGTGTQAGLNIIGP